MQGAAPQSALTETERALFSRALAEGGKLGRSQVIQWSGCTEWRARKWLEQWALRGWVSKDPQQSNSYAVAAKMQEMLSNHSTAPTFSNALQLAVAALQPTPTGLDDTGASLKGIPCSG